MKRRERGIQTGGGEGTRKRHLAECRRNTAVKVTERQERAAVSMQRRQT